jgi:hypothetical protein
MAYGFVYVLKNESMPGIYKIGFTTKHPKERMESLSQATACPTPFDLLAYFGCERPHEVEREIHQRLKNSRVNHAREFFRADPSDILELVREWSEPDDACFMEELLFESYAYNVQQRNTWLLEHFVSQGADPFECEQRGFD